jgi:RecB family exonuclease
VGALDSSRAFELAEPAEREAAAAVRARRPHFSASALNAYAECERKWFYRYVCAAVDDPGSAASAYGSAFHLALEHFHERYVHPQPDNAAAMHGDLAREIDAAFAHYRHGFPTAVEFEIQVRRAHRTARKYVEWLAAESKRAPFTVVGRELPVQLDLEGFTFIGFIDRLDRDAQTGGVTVVDYKTGSIAASAAEYLQVVREFGDFQLPFYYWVRTAAGDRVTRLALLPLKDALLDVRPVSLEVVPVPAAAARRDAPIGTISIADLERAKERMIEICHELTSARPRSFAPATDPQACVFCAYALACTRRPPPDGNRFGR